MGFEPLVAFDAEILAEKSKVALSIINDVEKDNNLVTTKFARGTAEFSAVSLQA